MYKSQLQEYAQKAGLMPPTYDHVKEGAPHEPRFKSTVWVNDLSYESPPVFSTVRSAEHATVKHESGLCKNLLQEFAQKNVYPLPQYKIMRQGKEHSLIFTATVEIAGVSYSGGGAKSKKEAEIKLSCLNCSFLPFRPLNQVANFVKSHPKRKKRGRVNPSLIEEPLATRIKQGLGYATAPNVPDAPCSTSFANSLTTSPAGGTCIPSESCWLLWRDCGMPDQWNQELGVCTVHDRSSVSPCREAKLCAAGYI